MADAGTETIRVEVAFAMPEKQVLRTLAVPQGASVADVLRMSNLAKDFPGMLLEDTQAGIWGRPVDRDHLVGEGDRVELYRPLAADPRDARRRLAKDGRTMGSGGR